MKLVGQRARRDRPREIGTTSLLNVAFTIMNVVGLVLAGVWSLAVHAVPVWTVSFTEGSTEPLSCQQIEAQSQIIGDHEYFEISGVSNSENAIDSAKYISLLLRAPVGTDRVAVEGYLIIHGYGRAHIVGEVKSGEMLRNTGSKLTIDASLALSTLSCKRPGRCDVSPSTTSMVLTSIPIESGDDLWRYVDAPVFSVYPHIKEWKHDIRENISEQDSGVPKGLGRGSD